VKEEMPLARKAQPPVENASPALTHSPSSSAASSVPHSGIRPTLAAEAPPEKTRDLLKEALEKFAAKENDRLARAAALPQPQKAQTSLQPPAAPNHTQNPKPKMPPPFVPTPPRSDKETATHTKSILPTPARNHTPVPPPVSAPASTQKSAEEIELEALRALLQDDE
jgi:hypothetical protein